MRPAEALAKAGLSAQPGKSASHFGMRILGRLGCKVDIVVKPQGRKRVFAPIRVDSV